MISETDFNSTDKISLPFGDTEKEPTFHYMRELQKLVALVFTQMARTNQNDQKQIRTLEKAYQKLVQQATDEQTGSASYGSYGAIASCAFSFLQFGMPNDADRNFLNILSQQSGSFASTFATPRQARGQNFSALGQLKLEEYRNKTAARQSEGGFKQECSQLLETVRSLQQTASKGG